MLLKLSKLLCYSRIAKTSKVCTIFERQPSLLQPSKAEYQVVKAITLFSETYVLCIPCHTGRFNSNFPHIFKSNTKFELLYESGPRVNIGVKSEPFILSMALCQMFCKVVSNYVLISDFATRPPFCN